MKPISLTTFVNFAIKAHGTSRISYIKQARKQYESGYTPEADFYKRLREAIVDMHRNGNPKSVLDPFIGTITHTKKVVLFTKCVSEYKKWMGNKSFTWINFRNETITVGKLPITLNPELGLEIDGDRSLIKLHLLKEEPSKYRTDVILHLMSKMGPCKENNPLGPCILDVQRGRLVRPINIYPDIETLLLGEADMFIRLWNGV
jgi:hypothetical protein